MGESCGMNVRVLTRKIEKKTLGIFWRIWEDNIRIDVCEVGSAFEATYRVRDRDKFRALVKTVMNLHVQYKVGNSLLGLQRLAFQGLLFSV
jgi:hypothetical protein